MSFRGDSYTQIFTFLPENLQGQLKVAGRDDTHDGQLNAPWKDQMTSTLRQHQPDLEENYFTSSDPHHDMLGGGCQVRVVIEDMMGRMENLRTLISGFLGLVILVRWALVTMFLS